MAIRISEVTTQPEGDVTSPDKNPFEAHRHKFTCLKIFKVEGSLHLKDVQLLEDLCKEVSETGCALVIEVGGLCFVDVESARVLCRLRQQQHVQIKGMNLFTRKIMDVAECGRADDKS